MPVRFATATHVGRVRTENEDRCLAGPRNNTLFAVADGMGGGHDGGEAAAAALQTLVEVVSAGHPDHRGDLLITHRAFDLANRAILDRLGARAGTTLTSLLLGRDTATIGQAGDSRCVRVRGGRGTQVTEDQSLSRHELRNCLGWNASSFSGADVRRVATAPGDVFVLHTDGLEMGADEIAKSVRFCQDSKGNCVVMGALAKSLIEIALDKGGLDNVTVVVVQVL